MNWDLVWIIAGTYLLIGAFLTKTYEIVGTLWFKVIPGILGVLMVIRYLSLIGAI